MMSDLEIKEPMLPYRVFDDVKHIPIHHFRDWFDRAVEPINRLLREGVEVREGKGCTQVWTEYDCNDTFKTGLLINVQEIKKESAEDLLRELKDRWETNPMDTGSIMNDWCNRAKKVLGDK